MRLNELLYLFSLGGYYKGKKMGVIIVQTNQAKQKWGAILSRSLRRTQSYSI